MRITSSVGFVLLVYARFIMAQAPEHITNRAQHAEPIAKLPPNVIAPPGEISLFADYNDVHVSGVVLYLVNRTDRRIAFPAQDDALFVMLEVREGADWVLAQYHYSSDCGNSYIHHPSLRPNEFFRFSGLYPNDGSERDVRFRMYTRSGYTLDGDTGDEYVRAGHGAQETPLHLISNQGVGRVPDELIEKARSDPMNFSFGGFSAVRDWAFGVVKGQDRSGFARASAIRELKRFATTESAEALLTLTNEPDREIMHAAIETLAILGADCPMAEAYYQSLLSDLDVARRASAILSLAERPMTPEIITALGDLMEQSNLQLRWAAIYALAKSCGGYPEIHSILMRHTYEPDYELRRFVDTAQHRELGWCCQEK